MSSGNRSPKAAGHSTGTTNKSQTQERSPGAKKKLGVCVMVGAEFWTFPLDIIQPSTCVFPVLSLTEAVG